MSYNDVTVCRYSYPNVILSFIGGYLIDKVFGVRLGAIIFASFCLLGQVSCIFTHSLRRVPAMWPNTRLAPVASYMMLYSYSHDTHSDIFCFEPFIMEMQLLLNLNWPSSKSCPVSRQDTGHPATPQYKLKPVGLFTIPLMIGSNTTWSSQLLLNWMWDWSLSLTSSIF